MISAIDKTRAIVTAIMSSSDRYMVKPFDRVALYDYRTKAGGAGEKELNPAPPYAGQTCGSTIIPYPAT
jgi:hypothetical protein